MKPKSRCLVCSLVRSAPVHGGSLWEHDFEGEPRARFGEQRKQINPIGERGYERRERWRDAKASHLQAQPTCQGPEAGLPGACGRPGTPQGIIDVQHIIPRGMGGGRDYGEYVTLCRKHHEYVEMHRDEGRSKGMLKKAPPSWGGALFEEDDD